MMATPAVCALAGRRFDAPDSPAEFPGESEQLVRQRLVSRLRDENVVTLVVSAACGADILALEAAHSLGIATRVILPFEPSLFLETSLLDRCKDWKPRFEEAIGPARGSNQLVVLSGRADAAEDAYRMVTSRLVADAADAAATASARKLAVAVWNGVPRENGDATADFVREARDAGFDVRTVETI